MIVNYLTCILIEQPLPWEHFLHNFIIIPSKVYIFRQCFSEVCVCVCGRVCEGFQAEDQCRKVLCVCVCVGRPACGPDAIQAHPPVNFTKSTTQRATFCKFRKGRLVDISFLTIVQYCTMVTAAFFYVMYTIYIYIYYFFMRIYFLTCFTRTPVLRPQNVRKPAF